MVLQYVIAFEAFKIRKRSIYDYEANGRIFEKERVEAQLTARSMTTDRLHWK